MISVEYSKDKDQVVITMSHEEATDYYLGETEGTSTPNEADKILELLGKLLVTLGPVS